MKNTQKIKKFAGKTIKNIIANEYRLLILFEDGTVLDYHLMTDDLNHIDILTVKDNKRDLNWRYKELFEK